MFQLRPIVALCILCTFASLSKADFDRSPVDLVLSADESWLATANQTSNSVSLVSVSDGKILDEIGIGERPAAIVRHPSRNELFVTSSYGFALHWLAVVDSKLVRVAEIPLGSQATGVAISPDGLQAYVALTDIDAIAVCDLAMKSVTDRIAVGRWPRYIALSEDGKRLAVGTSGDRGISIVDIERKKLVHIDRFIGLNIGHLRLSKDGQKAYFPWIVYRRNPINERNIKIGWVLASRLGRIGFEDDARREAISLDPAGKAVADPHGIDLTPDERLVVITASGSHELLVLQNDGLPFQDRGSTDHIDDALLSDSQRFYRIELGGRPMGLRISRDGRSVYIANYLDNSVQIVDLASRRIARMIPLGGASTPTLARKGETIFFDGRRSLDQWYSCHSCHYEGGINSVAMDTINDGTSFTFKTVLPLYELDKTGPWTWHGWQKDLRMAMNHSLKTTMQGPEPDTGDEEALIAYLANLKPPPHPSRQSDQNLSSALERGRLIFEGPKGACSSCHQGSFYTDGEIHDVGTGSQSDAYRGYNTPTLKGLFRKVHFSHDGSAVSLKELLSGPHAPERISGSKLSESELSDLIVYLNSL